MVAPLSPDSIPSEKFRISACGVVAVTAAFAPGTNSSNVPKPLASQISILTAVKLNIAMVQKQPYILFLFVMSTLQRITFNNQ